MATMSDITALSQVSTSAVRLQMEELLFDFYSAVGASPRRPFAGNASDLLADDFEGRFFSRDSSELSCFDKPQMLVADFGHRDLRPNSQLIDLRAGSVTDSLISVNYEAAFRYGQTLIVRRGTFKAVMTHAGWALRSIDEDMRVTLLPESRRRLRAASDLPRVWIR